MCFYEKIFSIFPRSLLDKMTLFPPFPWRAAIQVVGQVSPELVAHKMVQASRIFTADVK